MGWISPVLVRPTKKGSTLKLYPLEQTDGTRAIKIIANQSGYYLIESRSRTGYDSDIPKEGVLVTFVDESKGSGRGIVRVVHTKSRVASVNDAAHTAGEWFSDTRNSIYVYAATKEGEAYDIQVSSDIAIIDIWFPKEVEAFVFIAGKIGIRNGLCNPIKNVRIEISIDGKLVETATCDDVGEAEFTRRFSLLETGNHILEARLIDEIAWIRTERAFSVAFPDWIWYVAILLLAVLVLALYRRHR